MALYLISQLKKKTIILVHKSFLMNQWHERISQFLPDAQVGYVQGPTVDVRGKDVVIGMIQSIATKEYPPETFADFGLVVADEAHHLGAEVFCRALPKVASRYTLGLTATPHRKDGLTRVFKWYLGDTAYAMERQDTHQVVVKKIVYRNPDPKYCRETRNYKGTIMLPGMTSNLVACAARNALILHEVVQYVAEEQRQVMVVSERLAHLKELRDAFDALRLQIERDGDVRAATSGFYTGKQKQRELDESEKCDVVFSTKQMVAEALDIQSLNTLVMATPAGDVVQMCGRILRKQHAVPPLIVDVVDSFSVYIGQSRKRDAFYKKCSYMVHRVPFSEGRDALSGLDVSTDEMALSAAPAAAAPAEEADSPAPSRPPAAGTVAFVDDEDE